MREIGALVLVFAFCASAIAIDKKDLEQRYKENYLVVLRDGLSVGICSTGKIWRFRPVIIFIDGDRIEFDKLIGIGKLGGRMGESGYMADNGCGGFVPEALQKGEILHVKTTHVADDDFSLTVETVSPHSITRGRGANEHESHEIGKAEIHFPYPTKRGYDEGVAIADKWFKPLDTLEAAASFGKGIGNTASGAFVKEVKLGMTPGEVEGVMGLPVSKADLGEKVLYKYKDMTVEFHDGKVTDVR